MHIYARGLAGRNPEILTGPPEAAHRTSKLLAALTLSCVPPGQDEGVAPPGRRLPSPLPTRQGKWPFYAIFSTPREARTGETQIPFGGRRSHRAAAQTVADRHQRRGAAAMPQLQMHASRMGTEMHRSPKG